ncbi:MAG: DEAD/DEAH box helicase [Gammaproteobacteria bacterium]|nr:DEAD/DEAH box helicase [Gammaproteobacteria bacterium]
MSNAFATLGLGAGAQRAIAARDYVEPTAVQREAIPAVLAGRDVWACAQTGSGKTAAFALPIIQRCALLPAGAALQALVLVPTRELAQQVAAVCEDFAREATRALKVVSAFGGVSINPQMMALRGGADIVVATPGRLLDLIEHNALRLDEVHTLVLDEADRLFDLGFAEELARVLTGLPVRRQNLLFSATFPEAVHALAEQLLHDPLRIDVPDSVDTTPRITQRAIAVDRARRTPLLRHLIEHEAWPRTLVFTATRYSTEHVADKLRRAGLSATALHGELSQAARAQALEDFKRGRVKILIATDLAARGIDIVELPAVVNYDLPRSTDDYLHRIGRTGRAGASGVAVSFICADNAAHFALIEKRHGLTLTHEVISGFEVTDSAPPPAPGNGGIKGKRPSKKDKLREAAARRFVWPKAPL